MPTETTTGETTAIGTSCSRHSCEPGIARRPDDRAGDHERADDVGHQDGEHEAEPAERLGDVDRRQRQQDGDGDGAVQQRPCARLKTTFAGE